MSKEARRLAKARAFLAIENAKWPASLKPVPVNLWPADSDGAKRVAVWRSRSFLVQGFSEAGGVVRLSVNRTQLDDNGAWRDGITWDELQGIKDACGFEDSEAVELFPRSGGVVNVANLRHLWVLPVPLPFGWRRIK